MDNERKTNQGIFRVFGVLYRFGSGLFRLFMLLLVIAAVSVCFLFLYHYFLTSPYMKLEQINMEGIDANFKQELIRSCGLNADQSLLALNLNKLKEEMETHPWVRSVKLERRFPHTLNVQVEREVPLALVLMDRIYYMNRWGSAFKEVEAGDGMDFPMITGDFIEGTETAEKLEKAARMIQALASEKGLWSLNELSEIHVGNDGGASLYFNHVAAEIKVACEDFTSQLEGLKKVAENLIHTGRIHQVSGINLCYAGGAVVSFREG